MLLVTVLLGGCRGASDRKAARDAIEGDIAEQLAPLQEDVDAASTQSDFDALTDELRSQLRRLEPPDGVKAVTLGSAGWSEFSEGTDERRYVGNAVIIIPDEPAQNEPYCLGVTVDNLDGVVFSPGGNASVAEGCTNLERAPIQS